MADTVRDLALAVAPKPRLVVLTGAGISAECGLQPYRGPGGRYEEDEAARFVTAEALAEERQVVLRHFAGWRDAARSASPGPAHGALVRLGKALGRRMTLVTQNVDTLRAFGASTSPRAAGSGGSHLIEMFSSPVADAMGEDRRAAPGEGVGGAAR